MSHERETYIQQTTGDKDLEPPQGPGWEVKGYSGGDADCWPTILWTREPVPDAWQDATTNSGTQPVVSPDDGFEPMGPWKQYAGSRYNDGSEHGPGIDWPQTHWRRPLRRVRPTTLPPNWHWKTFGPDVRLPQHTSGMTASLDADGCIEFAIPVERDAGDVQHVAVSKAEIDGLFACLGGGAE